MSLKDLVVSVKSAQPALSGMPDARATALVRAVFAQIGQELEKTQEGVVKVPGLGQFRVKQVEQTREGKKQMVKRVVFQAAKATAPTGKAGNAKGKAGG